MLFPLLTTLTMTSQLSSLVREKKEVPKVSIDLSQDELRNYINLQIKNDKKNLLNCGLDEYIQEGICRPCEEICGNEITQLCQTECKGYPLISHKRDNLAINDDQDQQIFFNRVLMVAVFVLLHVAIVLQILIERKKKTNGKNAEDNSNTGVGESQLTGLSTPMSVRSGRAGNHTENIPLVPLGNDGQQGGNGNHSSTQDQGSVGNMENVGRTVQEPVDRTFT